MAHGKMSARQIADAAAAVITVPRVDDTTKADAGKRLAKGNRPEGFTTDKPGFFRGARIRR